MNKSEEKAKTLLEYMGFKDPDIHTDEHDKWIMKLADEKILSKIIHVDKPCCITIEKILSDKYRTYGFLDIHCLERVEHEEKFSYWNNYFIEVKTGRPSLGQVIREMALYEDKLFRINESKDYGGDIFGFLISNLEFPESFNQFSHLTFDEVEKLIE